MYRKVAVETSYILSFPSFTKQTNFNSYASVSVKELCTTQTCSDGLKQSHIVTVHLWVRTLSRDFYRRQNPNHTAAGGLIGLCPKLR